MGTQTSTERLRVIYDGVKEQYPDLESFEDFCERIVLLLPAGSGGIAIERDQENPQIGIVQVYCPGALPKIKKLKAFAALAGICGFRVIYSETHNEIGRRIFRRMGWQELRDDLFSIRVKI